MASFKPLGIADQTYCSFKSRIMKRLDKVEHVCLVGTGNWKFSLNPEKNFKSFDSSSDIDVAVISEHQFISTWEEMRKYHRNRWYRLTIGERDRLRRNGENVYSGFISPAWIPEKQSKLKFEYLRLLNALRDQHVGFRPVKMVFFKNMVEAIDYYKRGFVIAQQKVRTDEV